MISPLPCTDSVVALPSNPRPSIFPLLKILILSGAVAPSFNDGGDDGSYELGYADGLADDFDSSMAAIDAERFLAEHE